MVGASGFEPPSSWSRTSSINPINALSGVAYGTRCLISPLLVVRNLYVETRPPKESASWAEPMESWGAIEYLSSPPPVATDISASAAPMWFLHHHICVAEFLPTSVTPPVITATLLSSFPIIIAFPVFGGYVSISQQVRLVRFRTLFSSVEHAHYIRRLADIAFHGERTPSRILG
jgi:hypothetical protein